MPALKAAAILRAVRACDEIAEKTLGERRAPSDETRIYRKHRRKQSSARIRTSTRALDSSSEFYRRDAY